MPEELSEKSWFKRLKKHAESGEPLDLRPGNSRPTFANPAHADLWPSDRVIPASAIGRILTLPESTVKAFHPDGLRIKGARIDGEPNWNRIVFPRQLAFDQCGFESPVGLRDSNTSTLCFERCHLPGLHLDAAQINGGVVAKNATIIGETSAIGAHISGQINLSNATLLNPCGQALSLDSSQLPGGLYAPNLTTTGVITAVSAHIGDLNIIGANCANADGLALRLDGAHIDGSLFAEELKVHGELHAPGIQVGGQLILSDATLTNPNGQALELDGARVGFDVYASGLRSEGEVRAIGAHISGELDLRDATLVAYSIGNGTNGDDGTTALILNGTQIGAGLIAERMTVHGEVRAIGAHISDRLDLTEATLTNSDGDVLVLERATVDQLFLFPARISGHIHLDLAKIGTLHVPPNPSTGSDLRPKALADSTLSAAGWSVTDIRGAIRRDWTVARSYLEHAPAPETKPDGSTRKEFIPQPWFEIADVYERIGHPDDARRLRLHTETQVTKNTHGPTKRNRRVYAATVGYGYRPFRPARWLIGVLVVAGLLIWTNQTQFISADRTGLVHTANESCTDTSGYSCFNAIKYTLQNVVPAASGPMRSDWALSTIHPWAISIEMILGVLRLVAWGFAALTLAAMTGLLRKR